MNGNANTRVLRSIVRALTADEYSQEEYETALRMVRSGRLASMIEPILEALAGAAASDQHRHAQAGRPKSSKARPSDRPKTEPTGQLTADGMFDLVKRRKITREGLMSILGDVNSDLVRNVSSMMTIREVLRMAKSKLDSRDWDLLGNIVSGKTISDSYLDRILNSR